MLLRSGKEAGKISKHPGFFKEGIGLNGITLLKSRLIKFCSEIRFNKAVVCYEQIPFLLENVKEVSDKMDDSKCRFRKAAMMMR